jgi:predicted membrane channel-forming protein YqfA (hemolysin III family)
MRRSLQEAFGPPGAGNRAPSNKSIKERYIGTLRENKKNTTHQEVKYHLWGWILFIVCAMFFIASGLKNQDILTLTGSVVFLIACILFIIPLVNSNNKRE